MSKLQPVRGTHDILPEEAGRRFALGQIFRALAGQYGYGEIQTPIFEFSEVFHRTLGDASDIVTKETYTFEDRGGESITLRPEFTASIVRAFLSNGMQQSLPVKWWYMGPAFRYERPQKGRQRQFTQVGAELIGAAEPAADVETIVFATSFLNALGLQSKVTLELNSLGDEVSRNNYRTALVTYYIKHQKELSEQSLVRLEKNPLRILDSKDEGDKRINADAPKLSEYFTKDASDFFAHVTAGLDDAGMHYRINEGLVRGLDYYSHSVFEFTTDLLGAQGTVLAGGRYDGLVEMMGGQPTPGIGFAAGIERLLALAADALASEKPALIAVVPIGEAAEKEAWKLTHQLRAAGFSVDTGYKGNAGKRLQRADKLGATLALMLGDEEIAKGQIAVKQLATGEQQSLSWAELFPYLRKTLGT